MRKLYYFIVATVVVVLTSCSSLTDKEPTITHRPFKYDKTDRWGMVGVDGTVLFENEFENEPSCVLNGIFFVENDNGFYEYYTAQTKPKRIGDKEYVAASYFVEDVAPVVEPEQHITFIKKDGSLAFKLDKYKDKDIVWASNFSDGLAPFKTSDNKCGFVNTKGEIVIEPKYFQISSGFNEGLSVVCESEAADKCYVINRKGEKQIELKSGESTKDDKGYILLPTGGFNDGYLAIYRVILNSEDMYFSHFINKKGETVFKAKDNLTVIGDVVDDKFLVSSNGKIGLMNMDGEMLIRPKYDVMESSYYYSGCALFDNYIKMSDRQKTGIIDFQDDVLVPFEYDDICRYYGSKAFAKDRDEWFLIDKKGERVDRKQAFAQIGGLNVDFGNEVNSDYFDAHAYVDMAMEPMTENSYDIIKLGSSAPDVTKKWSSIKLEDYTRACDWRLKLNGDFMERIIIPQYNEYVVKPIVEREQYGYYSWQYRDIIKGYRPNPNAEVTQIQVEFNLTKSIRNKNQRLRNAFENWAKSKGYKYSNNTNWNDQNWDVYNNSNGYMFVILRTDSEYSPMKIIISK